MSAELIVVAGPLLGERYELRAPGTRIGRAESAGIRLDEAGVAREHCVVSPRGEGWLIADCHTGAGTYVNGLRIREHALESGDQIAVGDTVFAYRDTEASPETASAQPILLRACSLLFLFRALAGSRDARQRAMLEQQIVALIGDLVPSCGGAVRLGTEAPQTPEGALLLPLYVRGEPAGTLAAWFPPEESPRVPDHRDTLSAIATLASAAIENALDLDRLRQRLDAVETGIIGDSPLIGKLVQLIGRVAPQDASVLILGESGTGKELVARALHRLSRRAAGPFVAINCAALTETLLESELFGHEKGAFTGAIAQKKGKLELAEGGTVFLDEIGELPASLQAKLLRVLQQREFDRVGGTRTMKLDVRVVAATNRDLATEVRRGAFREDLFHRLNVVALRVPALRERPGDIPTLAKFFLERASARCKRRVIGITPAAEQALLAYGWPGNVRELENAVERVVVLGESDMILPEDLPDFGAATAPTEALQESLATMKREAILAAWRESGRDHDLTAAKLKIHPNSLRRLIRVLNLRDSL